jgi:hypothetical protein
VRKSLSQRRSVECHADDTGNDFLSKPTDNSDNSVSTVRSSKKRKRRSKTKRPCGTESAPSASKRQRRHGQIPHAQTKSKTRAKSGKGQNVAQGDVARGTKVPKTIMIVARVPMQASLVTQGQGKKGRNVTFVPIVSKASRSSKKPKHRTKSKRHGTNQSAPLLAKRQRRNAQTPEGAHRIRRTKSASTAHADHALMPTTTNRKCVTWKDVASGGKVLGPPVAGALAAPMPACPASFQRKKGSNKSCGPIVSTAARPSNKHGTSCNQNDTLNRRRSTESISLHANRKQALPQSGSALNPINLVEPFKKVTAASRPMAHIEADSGSSQ